VKPPKICNTGRRVHPQIETRSFPRSLAAVPSLSLIHQRRLQIRRLIAGGTPALQQIALELEGLKH
jgi:hypothetical protein